MIALRLAVAVVLALFATPAWAQVDQLLKGLGIGQQGSGLSDVKVGAGLKEALQVATEKSVSLTGRTNGYFSNEAIKILMPEKLKTVEQGLRVVGYGPKVDEFVLSRNRAAEKAAPSAKKIFWDAIGSMTFDAAQKILGGGDTAATDFFKRTTTDKLTAAFKPVVDRTMGEVGVVRKYKELMALRGHSLRAEPDLRRRRLRGRQGAGRPLPRRGRAGAADPDESGGPHDGTAQGSLCLEVT